MKTYFSSFIKYAQRLSPLLMLVFLLLWLRSCQLGNQQAGRYQANLKVKETALRSYRLANGQLATDKDLLTVGFNDLKNQVWIKDDSLQLLLNQLKDPVVAVQWKTRYIFDTVFIPFEVPVPEDFRRSFSKREKWFFLSGTADQDGISIDSISIANTQRLVVGYKKGKPVVSVTNSNPHLLTEAVEGQLIRLPKRHWVLGLGGTWNLYEPPSWGVFVGYKLVEF